MTELDLDALEAELALWEDITEGERYSGYEVSPSDYRALIAKAREVERLTAAYEAHDAVVKERDELRRTLNFNTPTLNFETRQREAFNLLCRIANHDWLDDPTELRRALDGFVEEARALSIDSRRDMSRTGYV